MTTPSRQVTGSLSRPAFAQLLLNFHDRRVSGQLVVGGASETRGAKELGTVVFARGKICDVRTTSPVAYLGTVIYELGYIGADELDASLLELARRREPHGRILMERGAIAREQLAAALREQILRKLTHLLASAEEQTATFQAELDTFATPRNVVSVMVDPMPAVWRCLRDTIGADDVRGLLARLGSARCRLTKDADLARFQFPPDEQAVLECLKIKPMSVAELHTLGFLPPTTLGVLVYCLLFTKQLETIAQVAPVRGEGISASPPVPTSPHDSGTRTQAAAAAPLLKQAKIALLRNDLVLAGLLARENLGAHPEDAAAIALFAWITALDPTHSGVDATLAAIADLDHSLVLDPLCQDALYFRAQLHTRIENHRSALRDLKTLLEVNPKHLDAQRAFRLYQLRLRTKSVQLRAVDPNLTPSASAGSGVVRKAGVAPSARTKKA